MEWMLDLRTFGWLLGSGASEIIVGLLVSVLVVTTALWWWSLVPVPNMPPGPLGLPLVGYLPWIDPKAPHLTLSKLVERYGKVYSLKMGGVWTIVIADAKVVKTTFNLKSTAGRAPLYVTHGLMKGYGLICAEGLLWRDHRKFVAGFMRDQGMRAAAYREDMERRIHNVAMELINELGESQEPVDVSRKLLHHVGNTMNELVFGLKYAEEDQTWRWLRHLLEEGTKQVGVAGPMNFLPWLRFLPNFRRVLRFLSENQAKTHFEYQKIISAREMSLVSQETQLNGNEAPEEEEEEKGVCQTSNRRLENQPATEFLENHVDHVKKNRLDGSWKKDGEGEGEEEEEEEKKKTKANGLAPPLLDVQSGLRRISKDIIPKNIIEAYIKERSERGEDVGSFTYDQLHHVAADLFGAGSETTITTLRWHLLNMALFPQVQKRVHDELDDMAGDSDHVALDQASLLPFTQASLMETQRLRSTVPLGVPHGSSEDMTIEGYNVPAGTMLLPLLWYIHRDPEHWKDPDQYIPERFLDEGGHLIRNHPAFMPFQTGRRMCIGDEFAKMILFIFTSRILLKFKVSLEENNESCADPTKDPIVGISLCPRPFNLIFTPRMKM